MDPEEWRTLARIGAQTDRLVDAVIEWVEICGHLNDGAPSEVAARNKVVLEAGILKDLRGE